MAKVKTLLNLDSITKVQRELRLEGVSYPVNDISVDDFIATSLEAKRLVENDASMVEHIEASVGLIKRAIPSLPESIIRKQSIDAMSMIVTFINGNLTEEEPSGNPQPEATTPTQA